MNIARFSDRATRFIGACALLLIGAVVMTVGYQLVKMQLAVDVYRQRVRQLADNYQQLQNVYNQAVRKTAATELVVKDNQLCVHVRTAEGVVRSIPTSFDPKHEIFVDYVVHDSRLWIRRIYDDQTRPRDGLVIDATFGEVDWSNPSLRQGKVVYRALAEGRWAVTVTGGGSLGLAKIDDQAEVQLVEPPIVRDYPQIERDLQQQVDAVGPTDVLRRLVGATSP